MTGKVDSWKGRSLDDLVQAWGPPSSIQELSKDKRIATYSNTLTINGNSQECRVWFFIDGAGMVTNGHGDGQLGACSRLLSNKPEAR